MSCIAEYCDSVYSPYYTNDEELLEKVQPRFAKIMKGMQGKSYEERLPKLKLWSMEERKKTGDKIRLFR